MVEFLWITARRTIQKALIKSKLLFYWLVNFTDKNENALVETIITYPSLSDLETIMQMGMEQGMIAMLEKLDELLSTMKK